MKIRSVLLVFLAVWVLNAQNDTCQQGFALTPKGGCAQVAYIQGCHKYQGAGKCAECEFNYDLINGKCSYNEKDKRLCCLKFGENGECSICQSGLYLQKGACQQAFLTGCLRKEREQCINCASNFILQQGLCYEGVQGCAAYNSSSKTKCQRCKPGFTLNGPRCSPNSIIGCDSQTGDKCSKCYSPFTLVSGLCNIANCKTLSEFGCGVCIDSFFPKSDGLCYPFELGCAVHKHGQCANCSKGFALNNGKCLMDGCQTQSATGCDACNTGYDLVNRTCKLPNCVLANNGKCEICDDNFRVNNGVCVKPTIICKDFVGQVCRECAEGFYLGLDGHCHHVEPGCTKYEEGKCKNCSTPFELTATGCEIDGCTTYETTGCKECTVPYLKTTTKICKLKFCLQASKGICKTCETNYRVDATGSCTESDKVCEKYSDTSNNCLKCSVGFFVNQDGKCEVKKPGCEYQGSNCSNCTVPFTYKNGTCDIFGCKLLGEEGCLECKLPFQVDPKNKTCIVEGCTTYAEDGCKVCETPFVLKQEDKTCKIEKCVKASNKTCEVCEVNYVVVSGKCFKEDPNCNEYSPVNGKCAKCNTNYSNINSDTCIRLTKTDSESTKPNDTSIEFPDDETTKNQTSTPVQNETSTLKNETVLPGNQTKPPNNETLLPINETALPKNQTTTPITTVPPNNEVSNNTERTNTTNQSTPPNNQTKPDESPALNNTKHAEQILQVPPGVPSSSMKVIRILTKKNNTPSTTKKFPPTGFLYKDYLIKDPVTLLIKVLSLLSPVIDTPTALPGEADPPSGYQYVTIQIPRNLTPSDDSEKIYFHRVLQPTEDINEPIAKVGQAEPPASYQYVTLIEFVPGEGLEFEYVPIEKVIQSEEPQQKPEEVTQRVKKYIKILKTNIHVSKYGISSVIGNLTYSSVISSLYTVNASINSPNGWKAANNQTNEYVGIKYPNITKVDRVRIEPGENNAYPTEIYVEWSSDNSNFQNVSKTPLILSETPNNRTILTFSPVEALAIRLRITKYVEWPALRFEFLYTDETCREETDSAQLVDQDPEAEYDGSVVLAKKNTTIKNFVNTYQFDRWENPVPVSLLGLINAYNISKPLAKDSIRISSVGILTYSSIRDLKSFNYTLDENGWAAQKNLTDQFVGIVTPFPVRVTDLEVKATDDGSYISEFEVEYRVNLETSNYIRVNKRFKVEGFPNNSTKNVAIVSLGNLPNLMEIRIIVKKYINWPAMRFDILYEGTNYLAFLENAAKYKSQLIDSATPAIPSAQGTWTTISHPGLWQVGTLISSGTAKGFEIFNLTSRNGWKSSTNSTPVYAGLLFTSLRNVTGVKISNGTNTDVINFAIEYSTDETSNFLPVPLQPNFTEKDGVKTYLFVNPVRALRVRILVHSHSKWPGFKFDFLGALPLSSSVSTAKPQQTPVPTSSPNTIGSNSSNVNQIVQYDLAIVTGKLVGSESLASDGYSTQSIQGWVSKTNSSRVEAGISFDEPTRVDGVIIGKGTNGSIKSFEISYLTEVAGTRQTLSVTNLSLVQEGTYIFTSPVTAVDIRIVVTEWVGWPSFKFDFVTIIKSSPSSSTNNQTNSNTNTNLGWVCNSLNGSVLGAPVLFGSVLQTDPYRIVRYDLIVIQGKLVGTSSVNSEYSIESTKGWISKTNTSKAEAGLSFNNKTTKVSGVVVGKGTNGTATVFSLKYLNGGANWQTIPVSDLLQCNEEGVSSYMFRAPILATEIRIVILEYKDWPSMKFDFIRTI